MSAAKPAGASWPGAIQSFASAGNCRCGNFHRHFFQVAARMAALQFPLALNTCPSEKMLFICREA